MIREFSKDLNNGDSNSTPWPQFHIEKYVLNTHTHVRHL